MIQRATLLTASLVAFSSALFACSSGVPNNTPDSGGCTGSCSDSGSGIDAGGGDAGPPCRGDGGSNSCAFYCAPGQFCGASGYCELIVADGGSGTCQPSSCAGCCSGNSCVLYCPEGQICSLTGYCTSTPASSGNLDAGPCVTDGGVYFTIGQVRSVLAGVCPAPVRNAVVISNAVVTSVLTGSKSSTGTKEYFWVEDPAAPQFGLWVEKFTTDYATDSTGPMDFLYKPTPGDNLTINGFVVQRPAASFSSYNAEDRATMGDEFLVTGTNPASPLWMEVASGTPLTDNPVPAGFGNSLGGTAQANPEFSGARVHIPGPLTVTDGSPIAMASFSSDSTAFPPLPSGWNGFEVGSQTGTAYQHILVSDYKTYAKYLADGGPDPTHCGFGEWVRDGGTAIFPNGISGVWDTYAQQPCQSGVPDGGSFCPNTVGVVPGANCALQTGFVYVLWPQNCTTDLVGVMQ
jgi:hypothetical protein